MAIKMRLRMKNRSHIYNINGPRLRYGHKIWNININIKYKMCNGGYMYKVTPKQHLKLNSWKS